MNVLADYFFKSFAGFLGEGGNKSKRLLMRVLMGELQESAEENIYFVEVAENIADRLLALGRERNAYSEILVNKSRICETAQGLAYA